MDYVHGRNKADAEIAIVFRKLPNMIKDSVPFSVYQCETINHDKGKTRFIYREK